MLLNMSRNKFEPWEEEDSKRLASLYSDLKERTGITQKEFAMRYGFGTQGNLSHYLSMRQPLNLEAVIKFANAFDCQIDEISPELANLAKQAISRLDLPQPQNWPFKSITYQEYQKLDDFDKREIEATLGVKAERVRPRKSNPAAA